MPVVQNDVERYQPDQLVVEQRYTRLVQAALSLLGIAATVNDDSDALSLTLVDLPGVDSAAAVLRQDSALVQSASRGQQARGQTGSDVTDLDLVLFALRRSMRAAHDGWVATVGKNRILDRVQGLPYIKGGMGQPEPVAPLSIPPVPRQAGARVAVLDTRIFAHPALAGRFFGDPVADLGSDPLDTKGHSTFIVGLIAQRAPAAEIVVRQVLDGNGENASSWDVAKKMAGTLDAGVAVLNVSLGAATNDGAPPFCLQRAVERLTPSVVVVAAVGNNGCPDAPTPTGPTPGAPIFPAAIDGVVAVGAYDSESGSTKPVKFSPVVPWLDLLAPGVRVRSTFLSGQVQLTRRDGDGHPVPEGQPMDFGQPGYAAWDGTSFAAANVSGAIAALIEPGHLSAYDALHLLRNPAAPGGDIFPYVPG